MHSSRSSRPGGWGVSTRHPAGSRTPPREQTPHHPGAEPLLTDTTIGTTPPGVGTPWGVSARGWYLPGGVSARGVCGRHPPWTEFLTHPLPQTSFAGGKKFRDLTRDKTQIAYLVVSLQSLH